MKLEKPALYEKLNTNYLHRRPTTGYTMICADNQLAELERLQGL
jgi:hypothetical protein